MRRLPFRDLGGGSPGLVFAMGSVTGVTLVTLGAYLVAVLLVSRALSREDFGYFNLWMSALGVLGGISLLGYPNALVRNAPRERLEASDWPRLGRPLSGLTLITTLIGTAVFTAIYRIPTPDALWLLAAAAFIGQTQFPATILQILRRFALAQALLTLWRPALLIGVLALGSRADLRVWIPGLVAAGGFVQLLIAEVVLRNAPRGPAALGLRGLTPDAAVFSGLYVTAVLLTRLDGLFLAKLMDLEALGLYSALSFFTLTGYGVVAIAVGQVLRPALASREPHALGRLTLGLAGAGLAVGAGLTLVSPTLVPAVFSHRYAGDHRTVVGLLALSGVLQVLYAIPSSRIGVVSPDKSLRAFVPVSLSAVAVDVALLVVLVPALGLEGAALASALTWTWRTGTAWWVAGRRDGGAMRAGSGDGV